MKTALKVFLFITFPVYCLPLIIYFAIQLAWLDFNDNVFIKKYLS